MTNSPTSNEREPRLTEIRARHCPMTHRECPTPKWQMREDIDFLLSLLDSSQASRAAVAAPQGDAHDPTCCVRYMRGEPVPDGAHECGNIPWCRRCRVCIADAELPASSPVPPEQGLRGLLGEFLWDKYGCTIEHHRMKVLKHFVEWAEARPAAPPATPSLIPEQEPRAREIFDSGFARFPATTSPTATSAEPTCKCGLPKDDPIHSYTTEWQQMHTFIPKSAPPSTQPSARVAAEEIARRCVFVLLMSRFRIRRLMLTCLR